MKTTIFTLSTLFLLSFTNLFAQDRTVVTANNSEISDNLDLRAVASVFGDSKNLDDFERRLNDPKYQISNLDLNNDNQVDYLRVIESVEGNTHLIIIQSVLGRDVFQDIATVEVEKDRSNRIQVQVVGNVYMYGNNYIYEPVYAYTPLVYAGFWISNYRPYYSSWYWGYYPNYYYGWTPYPVYRYRNHINICINSYNQYHYVNYRRCDVAYNNYYKGRKGNAYEVQYPSRSFSHRNNGYSNRYELENKGRGKTSKQRNELENKGRGKTSKQRNELAYNSPNHSIKNNARQMHSNTRKEVISKIESPKRIHNDVSPRYETPKNYNNQRKETPQRIEKSENHSYTSAKNINRGNKDNDFSPQRAQNSGRRNH